MTTTALGSLTLASVPVPPLFAHGPPDIWALFFHIFGGFVLAGLLLIVSIIVWFWNRRAAGLSLLAAALFFLVGWCTFRSACQEPGGRERDAWWAAEVASDPIELRASNLHDEHLTQLHKTTRLKKLDLGYCFFTGAGLQNLSGLNQLESLDLQESVQGDEDLEILKGLTQLQELNISNNHSVGDAGIKKLAGLARLRKLNIACTGTTDVGLESLKVLRPGRVGFVLHQNH